MMITTQPQMKFIQIFNNLTTDVDKRKGSFIMCSARSTLIACIGLFMFAFPQDLIAGYDGPLLGEPEYKVTNGDYVNVAGSAISYSLSDVSIGSGALSLSHSISVNANDLVNWAAYYPGYKDKYLGGIRRILYSKDNSTASLEFDVISVSDEITTTNFVINAQGGFDGLKNQLSKLEVINTSTYALTRPDGTIVTYTSEGTIPTTIYSTYEPRAYMSEIKYPNGFTITIHKDGPYMDSPIKSVNSNNGLQLKYVYERHNRPLAAAKQSVTTNPSMPADSLNWSVYHPVKIIALNNAVETCPLLTDTCTPSQTWPEANYNWPDGMPRDFYIGESVFTVTNAEGQTTEFHNKALSKGYRNGLTNGSVILPGLINEYYPRIVKIKSSIGYEVKYGYTNYTSATSSPPWIFRSLSQAGVLSSSTHNNKTTTYRFGQLMNEYQASGSQKMIAASSGGYQGIDRVINTFKAYAGGKRLTSPFIIETWDKNIYLTEDFANQVESIENKLTGITTNYYYDSKGRLAETTDGRKQTVIYPSGNCTPKNCNKPVSTSNSYNEFQGSFPVYTSTQYSASHGGILQVAYPPNASGTIARSHFSYQNLYARYKNSAGTIVNSTTPISLVTSTWSCQNSNLNYNNCAGNDKVSTTFQYGTGTAGNNLFMIGKVLTTQADNKTYTTCYKYDKYGNQIEESQPESGIADCNVGRGY